MNCVRCGRELIKGQYFCDSCGEPVNEGLPNFVPQRTIEKEKPENTGITLKPIIVGALAVIVLGGMAALIYYLGKISWLKVLDDVLMFIGSVSFIGSIISLLALLFKKLAKKDATKIKPFLIGFIIAFVASGLIASSISSSNETSQSPSEQKVQHTEPEPSQKAQTAEYEVDTEVWDKKESTEHIIYLLSDKSAIVSKADKSGKTALYLTVQGKINKLPVIAIEDKAFQDCKNLKNINLPGSLKKIGAYAFAGCPNILKFKLPDSLEEIGDYAFQGCTSLAEIRIPKKVTKLEPNTFKGTKLSVIYIPDTCEIPEGSDPFGLGKKCKIEFYETKK